ncbi:lipopolysaccharide biosynthesis protein [uncultured Muribaculum sp.]|uniref:lipopolysaccharide biosynthesis protein n=1 Tax=uncultured Muribaculum sp. TaxID=1918613 RepID=UPI0025F430C8|nr:polysaccharide biosynthesis C-terminal domain-containing protein [uncultured Muribaculum sp.]
MALSLLSNPWIAKNMSPEDYAISGYYSSYTSLIQPIIIFYLIHYYIKEYYRVETSKRLELFAIIARATIWFSGIISIICFIGILIYLKVINNGFQLPIHPYLALMVFSLPLCGLMNLQLAQYRMKREANKFFLLSVANGVLNIFLSVTLVVILKLGAVGKLLGPMLCNVIVFFIMLWKHRHLLKVPTNPIYFRQIIRFCFPLALSAMLGYFTNGFSTTYLEKVGEINEYGVYIVGYSIGSYLSVFGTAIGNTFQPDLYETVIKRNWKKYISIIIIEICMVSVIVLIFIFLAPYIISILTANRYTDATPYAQVLALSTITSTIYYLSNQFSIATNKPKLYLYTSIIGSVIIVLTMPMVVGKWAFWGGAWMNVLSFLVLTTINIILLLGGKYRLKKHTNSSNETLLLL